MDEESVCPGGPTSPPQEEMEVTVATQLGSLIVSPDNADPSSNAPTVSEENGDSLATALSLNGVCKTEDCDGDEDDSEDSDSDSSSSSSSSSPSALVIEDDDDEGFSQPVPIKTRDEVLPEELPAVEEVSVSLPEDVELQPVGTVSSIIQQLVVIQSLRDTPALIDDSIIFTSDRQAVGKVFEVFGPVSSPLYILRLNSVEQISSKGLKEGLTVYYAPAIKEYTGYILTQQLKLFKGSDASWKNDQEPPAEALDYSDDEKEKQAKRKGKNSKKRRDNNTTDNPAQITQNTSQQHQQQQQQQRDSRGFPPRHAGHSFRHQNPRNQQPLYRHTHPPHRHNHPPSTHADVPPMYLPPPCPYPPPPHHHFPPPSFPLYPPPPSFYNPSFSSPLWPPHSLPFSDLPPPPPPPPPPPQ
ncbi:H/ACA ribonucleoprotein complex non-core subunit NAF1 [Scophthalmus maximus]|nr:H/ACA ribonucleoprotein complex non-core subunit NAF1 [Scophthalmus maximus]XP_035492939.1 H/ACA ribonucleoprotein complex non-core subunit NAF1 [Scophthalmus maximus]XP_035492940.1 H/ACA ribonucleoprotein complex non-core subunit NAF1 [Scophthalmus maximus]XP_035492941.1 H/ACA ribonucleoprotein complex non-core subunit NAF1 [Scophthalmus maximus]